MLKHFHHDFSSSPNRRYFIATATALATAAIVGGLAAGTAGIAAAASKSGGDNKGGDGGQPQNQNAPSVSSGSQDISREEMRKRGRAALIATGSQGVLENAPTGRATLLGN